MTSKCGKNKKVAHEAYGVTVSFSVFQFFGKVNSVFLIRAALWGEKLNIAGVQIIRSENMRLRSTLIRVLNERRFSDGGNLCPLWLVILKLV